MLRRKNVKHYGLVKPSGVGSSLELVTSAEKLEDGNVINRVSLQDVSLAETDERLKVISPEDYTLENLMKAGVPLDQINLSGFMSPTDKAVISEIQDTNALNAFAELQKEEFRISQEKAKAVKTEQKVNENEE